MARSRWIGLGTLLVVAAVLGACSSNKALSGGKLYFTQTPPLYDKALAQFQLAVEADPKSGEAHLWLARALAELDRDTEAIQELKQARELDPLQEEMVNNTFVSYWSRRYNSALTYAKEGEDAQRAGDAARARDQLIKSEQRFRRALEYCPDSVQNYSNLGKILYRLERREEALAMFHRAKEMSTGRPDLQRFLFHLFKELGSGALERPTRDNMERGLGLLLDAASLPADDAQMAEVHMNIATIYRALADSLGAERRPEMLEKSATYFGKVLEAYPEDPDALGDLAYVYSDMGQHEQALQIGQQRVDLEPWAREPRLMMYRLYRAGKNDKDANGQFLVAQILQDGTPQPREGVRARVTQEFGPTSEMLKVLRDRGEPEEIRTYESGTAPFHMWAYWTGGRVYIFQNGIEKFRLAFKAVPREKLSEILQR